MTQVKVRKIIVGVVAAVAIIAGGVTYVKAHDGKSSSAITIGSVTSDADIWRHIAQTPQAKKLDLKISVKEFTDGATLNTATANGEIDVNAFQSYGYLDAFNKTHPNTPLVNLGTTYLEPLGIYSSKYKAVTDIPNGAKIAVAKDQADEARGLRLLAAAKLITLSPKFTALSGLEAITSNPHHFKFLEIDDTTGPRLLHDDSIGAVLISNSVSQAAGLNVLNDSIFYEHVDSHTTANINILATAKKNGDNESYKKLVKLYHDKTIQAYVTKEYKGTKTEVQKPVSYFDTQK
ncbi:ABC transporter substrate-binding protein [Periweissella cryptocerci]|uniref:ABC transporter substrate-binding protein n=1 Tax=Periweissella cryptocerci TaxID=2506420 RepID=A0A4P6YR44_9LACO|nr:MetQ/NlpA family ABC transporter substrate-binding protein [Periweissella cryptocerci]QBO35084.1 ABC transporter substrate-binding protein [Periweissella cryptocerci]